MAKNPPIGYGHRKETAEGQDLNSQNKREKNSIIQNVKLEELSEYEYQMKIARKIMREDYDVLRKLAQS